MKEKTPGLLFSLFATTDEQRTRFREETEAQVRFARQAIAGAVNLGAIAGVEEAVTSFIASSAKSACFARAVDVMMLAELSKDALKELTAFHLEMSKMAGSVLEGLVFPLGTAEQVIQPITGKEKEQCQTIQELNTTA